MILLTATTIPLGHVSEDPDITRILKQPSGGFDAYSSEILIFMSHTRDICRVAYEL
jgi:hypothetical protein